MRLGINSRITSTTLTFLFLIVQQYPEIVRRSPVSVKPLERQDIEQPPYPTPPASSNNPYFKLSPLSLNLIDEVIYIRFEQFHNILHQFTAWPCFLFFLLPPANGGNVFTPVCHSV